MARWYTHGNRAASQLAQFREAARGNVVAKCGQIGIPRRQRCIPSLAVFGPQDPTQVAKSVVFAPLKRLHLSFLALGAVWRSGRTS